jgi:predicted RNA-binding protein with PIN domain
VDRSGGNPHTYGVSPGGEAPLTPAPPEHPAPGEPLGPTEAGDAAPPGPAADEAGTPENADGADSAERADSTGDADSTDSTENETLDRPLPEGVRRRVVQLAAAALGGLTMAELPAPLRPYARFTPTRRAKYAATALAAALEAEPGFRQRIAGRFREAQPELCGALESGTPTPAADPLDVAAAAYLLRPSGWAKLVAAAGEEAQRADAERAGEEAARELRELREELAELREQTRHDAAKARADVDAARREADALARKLRSAAADVKRAEATVRKLTGELEETRSAAAADRAAAEGEARRLRSRLAEAEAAVEAGRRAVREGRSVEDVRLRLLLDTVLDAAAGLRRELALPPRDTMGILPADTVDAVKPGAINPKDIARRALAEDDPALLDQLLALPQAHLVVDGYNVTKTGYPSMPLEKQRLRLLGGLAALAAQSNAEVTCVFDGADLAAPVLLAPPRGVRVLFSKAGETADEVIRRLVRAEPPGRPVVVVSADREVADGVARSGARPVASVLLLKRLARV